MQGKTHVRITHIWGTLALAAIALTPTAWGQVWSDPAALNTNAATDSGADERVQVTTDGLGTWIAVWQSSEPDVEAGIDTDNDILVSRSIDDGATWTTPAPLNSNAASDSGDDRDPQVSTDGLGNWIAVWWSEETNIGSGIGLDFDILVSRSTDNGATWTAPEALNTTATTDSGLDRLPQVTTDGSGTWVAVWQSSEAAIGAGIGTDYDILVSRSTDNGATWTVPAALNTNAAADIGDDEVAQLTTDGLGTWLAVWMSSEPNIGSGIAEDTDVLVARSTDGGVTWTTPAPLNTNAATDTGDDYGPQLTTDGLGTWLAVWDSSEVNIDAGIGGDGDILVARSIDNGSTWTEPKPLNTNAATDFGEDLSPQVATDGSGYWAAIWTSSETNIGEGIGNDWDVVFSYSIDSGDTWSIPRALHPHATTDTGFDDLFPELITDGSGVWIAVCESTQTLIGAGIGDDRDILVSTLPKFTGIHSPMPLNANADIDFNDDEFPSVATDASGNWVAVWTSWEGTFGANPYIGVDQDIIVTRSTDEGATWTDPQPLNTNAVTDSGADDLPRIATDGSGTWLTAWESNEASIGSGIGTDSDILIAASTDDGVTWTAPAALNTNAGTDSGDDFGVQVATDGGGNWVAVWESAESNIGAGIGADADILVARSSDNGASWSAPAALNTNAGADTGEDATPYVTTDGSGNWVAVWQSDEATIGAGIGTDYDVLIARSTDNGATWTAPAPLNTNATTDTEQDFGPRMANDGLGNWVAVWFSREPNIGSGIGTDYDVLVARSANNGTSWSPPAALNSNAAGDVGNDLDPTVTTDGSGVWVAAWFSGEANIGAGIGTDPDIILSRSVDNGVTWSVPEAVNTNAGTDSGFDGNVQLAADGSGHWVAVWDSLEADIGWGISTDADAVVARWSYDPIMIPDPVLEAAVRDALGIPTGPIHAFDMLELTTLEAGRPHFLAKVQDLTGLEYAANLQMLNLSFNNVSDLGPLAGLTGLDSLQLGFNNITDITPLSGLVGLTTLSLEFNNLTDLSPLWTLQSNLQELDLSGTRTSDVFPLTPMTNLTRLDLTSNNISDIAPLAGLTSLEYLNLGLNSISDLSALAGMTALNELYAYNNTVSDLSPLAGLSALTNLGLQDNNIVDISPLASLVGLQYLRLEDNAITDIGSVASLSALIGIDLSGNSISDIGALAGLTNLDLLFLRSNSVSDVSPLVANSGLNSGDYVDLYSNPLSTQAVCTDIPTLLGRGVYVFSGVACSDADGDGLTDAEEATLGTNPNNPDTDGDGLTDYEETTLMTNPLVADSDGDGVTDGLETTIGTDPLTPDPFVDILTGTNYVGDTLGVESPTTTLYTLTITPPAKAGGSGTIEDVDLNLEVFHSGAGTLSIELVSPNGTIVEVLSNAGQPGVSFFGTIFDDEAGTAIAAGTEPYVGRFQPQNALSAFDGESIAGDWTLIVTDSSGPFDGILQSWSLDIVTAEPGPGVGVPAASALALVLLAAALAAAGIATYRRSRMVG